MRHLKRANQYKAGTLTIHAGKENHATSYEWYVIGHNFKDIGYIVNDYFYSPSTIQQAGKLKKFLGYTGFTTLEAPKGLQDMDAAIKHYEYMIAERIELINKKGTRKSTNERRREEIETFKNKIELCNKINAVSKL